MTSWQPASKYNFDVFQVRSCLQGNVTGVEAALRGGASVEQEDGQGRTGLHYASAQGHLQVVELLLLYNADINRKSSKLDDDG